MKVGREASAVWKRLGRERAVAYDFFLSHSSRLDTKANRFIRAVAARLEQRGCKVFLDLNSLVEAMPLGPSIRCAIEESRVGVVMYSRASAKSRWVEYEICRMFNQKVKQSMSVWLLCLPSCGVLPGWVTPKDVLRSDDYRSPEHAADELLRRYKNLDL